MVCQFSTRKLSSGKRQYLTFPFIATVAAAGLPEKRKDHAIVMARFAHSCLQASSKHFKSLESTLGPDTGDLNIRIGVHSGPVTAGVLRGNRSRFQLYVFLENQCCFLSVGVLILYVFSIVLVTR